MPTLIYKVGDYLYNLHSSIFRRLSDIFKHIYTLPQGDMVEGKSDDRPFVLEGIEASDFNHLLDYLYHKCAKY